MSEFKELDFEPTIDSLVYLNRKIKDAGLLFHPFMVMQAIDNEKQRQFSEIVLDHFKGMKVFKLEECKEEIVKYVEAEQKRYEDHMKPKTEVPELVEEPKKTVKKKKLT